MFKLPALPSPQASLRELADFAELLCWQGGSVSKREIVAYLGRVDDNDSNVGCDDDDDVNSEMLDEVMNEIERRMSACGVGYPFCLDSSGTVMSQVPDNGNHRPVVYRFLLLSTRLDMKACRVHADLDGTHLFEEISAHALANYLGRARARSIVFGTARSGSFEQKVNALCEGIGEGSGFRSLDDGSVDAKDDKLDAVAWVPFSDSLPGKLIVFAQCKTGTTWGGQVAQLQPDAFIKKWFREPVLVDPVRAFCISEAADRSKWQGTCVEAGILLDRCRIVDFCDDIDAALLDRMVRWETAAKATVSY